MEHIEILTPKTTELPYFTVNRAVDYVDVVSTGLYTTLYSGQGSSSFSRGDNFIILSAGYFIPERFQLYGYSETGAMLTPSPLMYFTVLKQAGIHQPVHHIGNDGTIRIPFPNYEFSLGAFVHVEGLIITSTTFKLEMTFPYVNADPDRLRVSMIDVPIALDTKTFKIIPFVKISHTVNLS